MALNDQSFVDFPTFPVIHRLVDNLQIDHAKPEADCVHFTVSLQQISLVQLESKARFLHWKEADESRSLWEIVLCSVDPIIQRSISSKYLDCQEKASVSPLVEYFKPNVSYIRSKSLSKTILERNTSEG